MELLDLDERGFGFLPYLLPSPTIRENKIRY